MATLFVVATPIGNMEDISARALRVLSEVDTILCEDTRVTRKLLSRYDIHTQILSYHSHSSEGETKRIFSLLKEGKDLALVSDAGTPTISDPGILLVKEIREQFQLEEVSIVAVPGASALVSALSISGITSAQFTFLGFLPHKKGRETLFAEISESKRTMVFYESPHRIMKTLERLSEVLDDSRKVAVARELTKIYEEVVKGAPKEVFSVFTESAEKVRGEFVVIVEGKK